MTLGRAGSALLAAESRQSVLVVGPTQTRKTSGLAIPAMLERAGPVIATSIKTDLLRDTIASRTASGRVFVFDPTGCTGMQVAPRTQVSAADHPRRHPASTHQDQRQREQERLRHSLGYGLTR